MTATNFLAMGTGPRAGSVELSVFVICLDLDQLADGESILGGSNFDQYDMKKENNTPLLLFCCSLAFAGYRPYFSLTYLLSLLVFLTDLSIDYPVKHTSRRDGLASHVALHIISNCSSGSGLPFLPWT